MQPSRVAGGMVVGEPALPMGSCRSQIDRSKLPPGRQLGFRAVVVERKKGRRERRLVLREAIVVFED